MNPGICGLYGEGFFIRVLHCVLLFACPGFRVPFPFRGLYEPIIFGKVTVTLKPRSLSESIDSKAENLGLELIVLRATDEAVSFWQKMGYSAAPKMTTREAAA